MRTCPYRKMFFLLIIMIFTGCGLLTIPYFPDPQTVNLAPESNPEQGTLSFTFNSSNYTTDGGFFLGFDIYYKYFIWNGVREEFPDELELLEEAEDFSLSKIQSKNYHSLKGVFERLVYDPEDDSTVIIPDTDVEAYTDRNEGVLASPLLNVYDLGIKGMEEVEITLNFSPIINVLPDEHQHPYIECNGNKIYLFRDANYPQTFIDRLDYGTVDDELQVDTDWKKPFVYIFDDPRHPDLFFLEDDLFNYDFSLDKDIKSSLLNAGNSDLAIAFFVHAVYMNTESFTQQKSQNLAPLTYLDAVVYDEAWRNYTNP